MSLIILPNNLGPKIYYVTAVPRYTKYNGVGKRFPTLLAAAMGLKEALKNKCDEICVESQGRLPRRYKIQEIFNKCIKNPSLWQYLPSMAPTKEQKIVSKHMTRHLGLLN